MVNDFVVHDVQRSGRRIGAVTRPTSVRAALTALHDDPTARPLAGGTDLLVEFARSQNTESATVIDLTSITDFAAITETDTSLRLSGGVTHSQVVADVRFSRLALPLAQACVEIGSPQLRNRATIAGNLVTASPANDTISALMALGANLELASLDDAGELITRTVPVADFFTGFRETVLQQGELITAIDVPKLNGDHRGIWFKVGLRKNQAISVVHGAIVLGLEGNVVTAARLALGSVAATVVLIEEFTESLIGSQLSAEAIEAAARASAEAVSPISDNRGTAEYRTSVVEAAVRRSLSAIAAGEQANSWIADPPLLRTPAATQPAPANTVITNDTEINVTINGKPHTGDRVTNLTLLDWIQQRPLDDEGRGLWGTKRGCAEGECGACTVDLNGAAVMSCLVPAAQADGGQVVTIEGLAQDSALHPVQQAFVDEFAVQCGYCIPGFVVAIERLLAATPNPTDDQIVQGLGGNLCRCTGYYPIIQAIKNAAASAPGDLP